MSLKVLKDSSLVQSEPDLGTMINSTDLSIEGSNRGVRENGNASSIESTSLIQTNKTNDSKREDRKL